VLFLVLFTFAASALRQRSALESLLFAVALVPEFLPMITAITLSRGAVRMARKQVVVKQLAAIQNLGSVDLLCSDKTETLTGREMRLERSLDQLGNPGQRPLELAGVLVACESGIKNALDLAIAAQAPAASGWAKMDEIPFDFERRRVSAVVERPEGRVLLSKGAPEGLLPICTGYQAEG
jgi:Mg2+-importing ATPase